MTYYVGDSIEISAGATDFDGNPVTGATGTAHLSILEIGGDAAPVKDVEMPFSAPDSAFLYIWNTAGMPAEGGGYRSVVTLDVGGRKSVEARPLVLFSVDED